MTTPAEVIARAQCDDVWDDLPSELQGRLIEEAERDIAALASAGYAVVPVELDETMLAACRKGRERLLSDAGAQSIWKAAIHAHDDQGAKGGEG